METSKKKRKQGKRECECPLQLTAFHFTLFNSTHVKILPKRKIEAQNHHLTAPFLQKTGPIVVPPLNGLKDRVNQIMHSNASQPDGRVEYPVEARAVLRLVSLYNIHVEECQVCHFIFLCCCQTLFLPEEIRTTPCICVATYTGTKELSFQSGFDQGLMHWDLMLE